MLNSSWFFVAAAILVAVLFAVLQAQAAFTTVDVPAGTDPEASTGDTLTLASEPAITITGDASTDTVTFALDVLSCPATGSAPLFWNADAAKLSC